MWVAHRPLQSGNKGLRGFHAVRDIFEPEQTAPFLARLQHIDVQLSNHVIDTTAPKRIGERRND